MAWVGAGEWLPDNDVTGLCILHRYLIEPVVRHVSQIEILSPQPPSVSALKIRQVDSAKVVCVPKERVAARSLSCSMSGRQIASVLQYQMASNRTLQRPFSL